MDGESGENGVRGRMVATCGVCGGKVGIPWGMDASGDPGGLQMKKTTKNRQMKKMLLKERRRNGTA